MALIALEGGGNDAFVHITAIERSGLSTIAKDERVTFKMETDRRGKSSSANLKAA